MKYLYRAKEKETFFFLVFVSSWAEVAVADTYYIKKYNIHYDVIVFWWPAEFA